ncbi:MAG: DUF4115 domain-containing protein [Magnetococcus sp. XQGC-1]
MSIFKRRITPPRHHRGMAPQEELFADANEEVSQGGGADGTPPSAQQVGAFLRQVRERQGLTIGEMSRRTRIRDVYLLALESGEVDKLPGSTFVAGFLRLYAENLELEDRSFIERYLETSGGEVNANLHTELFPAPTTVRHRPSVVTVLGGVIALLLLFFVYENYYSRGAPSVRTPELPSTSPRRAGSLPPGGSAAGKPDLAESPPPEEKGNFVTGWLGQFFDQPAKNHWEEDLDVTPSPPPAQSKPGGVAAAKKESAAPERGSAVQPIQGAAVPAPKKATPVAPEPPARSAEKAAPAPAGVMTQKLIPEAEKQRVEEPGVVAALLQQGKEWFARLTRSSTEEGQKEGGGDAISGWLPPRPKGGPQSEEAVSPPAQPAPVTPPAAQTAPAKTPPERMAKAVVPEPPARVVAPLPSSMVAAPAKPVTPEPPPPAKGVTPPPAPPAKVAAPEPPPAKGVTPPPAPPAKVAAPEPPPPAKGVTPPPAPPVKVAAPEPPPPAKVAAPESKPPLTKGGDPAVVIANRYQEPVKSKADLSPESDQAVSLLANELVWVQIQDENGQILKDMVMQPNHLFRVPVGGRFFAVLGNAGAVRLRVGSRELPYLGAAGEELNRVELAPEQLLRRAKP